MGRGWCPGRVWPCQRHFRDVFSGLAYRIWFGSLLPRRWLQIRCAKRMLLRSVCDPPLETGMISSASALIGSSLHPLQFGFEQLGLWTPLVNLSFLSTGSPHSQQCVSSRMTRALILSRVCPLVRRGLILLPLRSMAMVLTALVFTPGLAHGVGMRFGAPWPVPVGWGVFISRPLVLAGGGVFVLPAQVVRCSARAAL